MFSTLAHFSTTPAVQVLDLTDMQPEWWASNFSGPGTMNNNNMRAGDLWNPPTQSVRFARNSSEQTRLQGKPFFPSAPPHVIPAQRVLPAFAGRMKRMKEGVSCGMPRGSPALSQPRV